MLLRFQFKAWFGILQSSMLITCPCHLSLLALIISSSFAIPVLFLTSTRACAPSPPVPAWNCHWRRGDYLHSSLVNIRFERSEQPLSFDPIWPWTSRSIFRSVIRGAVISDWQRFNKARVARFLRSVRVPNTWWIGSAARHLLPPAASQPPQINRGPLNNKTPGVCAHYHSKMSKISDSANREPRSTISPFLFAWLNLTKADNFNCIPSRW